MTNKRKYMKQRDRAKGDIPLVHDLNNLDPNGGVLSRMTCWRPRPGDPDPEYPGEKVFLTSYMPTAAEDPCPCGSGKQFGSCCQPLPYWRPLCPNPGRQGYSLMRSQSARFTNIPADAVYDFLQDDVRLYCVEDTPHRVFWVYWGDPALDVPYGTLCFGDFELQENDTLLITALSDVRMEALLEVVRPLKLGTPQIEVEPYPHLAKPVQNASEGKHQRK